MKQGFFFVIALVLLGLAAWLVLSECREEASPVNAAASPPVGDAAARRVSKDDRVLNQTRQAAASPVVPAASPVVPAASPVVPAASPVVPAASPVCDDADEAAVDSFDNLTDKWMEPSEKGVTMADADAFVREFKKVPKDRQEECLQRALNLVPDENVMLLAGVLMDKSQPKELVELVFNDVLNRDEDVKKPILQQIFKDKSHPCWANTAWILDVTGEKR